MKTVLVIPDLHCPAQHQDAIPFLKAVVKKYKPNEFVCIGDEIDAASLSRWDQDPDQPSAGDELKLAIENLTPFYKLFPKMKVCISNHTDRIYRKPLSAGIPKKLLRSYSEVLEAPKGWVWKDSWEIDGVLYEHGEGFTGKDGALKAAMANMQATVIGHIHSYAGIQYYANARYLIYGFNTGCLINKHAPNFNYGKLIKSKPVIGCGLVIAGLPLFIPMPLNSKGRWTGKL